MRRKTQRKIKNYTQRGGDCKEVGNWISTNIMEPIRKTYKIFFRKYDGESYPKKKPKTPQQLIKKSSKTQKSPTPIVHDNTIELLLPIEQSQISTNEKSSISILHDNTNELLPIEQQSQIPTNKKSSKTQKSPTPIVHDNKKTYELIKSALEPKQKLYIRYDDDDKKIIYTLYVYGDDLLIYNNNNNIPIKFLNYINVYYNTEQGKINTELFKENNIILI
jgi:hypothetical protein